MKSQPITFSSLPRNWQWLIRLMQGLNFGELHNLNIADGLPLNDGHLTTTAEYRFGGDNEKRPEIELEDFLLPKALVEFMEEIQYLGSHPIKRVIVKHGLPFKMEVVNMA